MLAFHVAINSSLARFADWKVVPGRQVADKVGGVQTRQFFFAHREGHNRDVIAEIPRGQFFVKADVGIAVDGRDHANLFAVRTKGNHIGHDLGPVRMAKGRVVHKDIVVRDAFGLQVAFKNVVGGARIDIVGAEQREFFDAQFFEEIIRAGIACWLGAAPV